VVLNKADLYPEGSESVRRFCAEHRLELVCEVPFDPAVPDAMAGGMPVTRFAEDSPAADALKRGSRLLKTVFEEDRTLMT
jgi:MinD superfamily P-loop ATPase